MCLYIHLLRKIYEKLKKPYNYLNLEFSSSLNNRQDYYINYCLPSGTRCTIDDFGFVRTPKMLKEHDELWSKLRDILVYIKS